MTLEAIVIVPVLLLTVMVVIQVALFAHASALVDAAAREGARAVRLSGDVDSGRTRATTFIHDHGDQVVLDPAVKSGAVGGVASVTVTGHAVGLIPGISLVVRGTSSGPVESFVGAGSRR